MARVGANITLNHDGRFWLTHTPPTFQKVLGMDYERLYIVGGEPLLANTVCPESIEMMLPEMKDEISQLQVGESIEVWVTIEKREK